MSEEVFETEPENLQQDMDGLDEVQGEWELDELVNDFQNEWCEHDEKKVLAKAATVSPSKHVILTEENKDVVKQYKQPVLELVVSVSDIEITASVRQQQQDQVAGPCKKGETAPWSLDWLSKQPVKAAGNNPLFHQGIHDVKAPEKTRKQAEQARSKSVSKKRKGALVKQSVGCMKKIARMSEVDRKQILHFLKKQKRSKKASKGKCQSTQADNLNFRIFKKFKFLGQ